MNTLPCPHCYPPKCDCAVLAYRNGHALGVRAGLEKAAQIAEKVQVYDVEAKAVEDRGGAVVIGKILNYEMGARYAAAIRAATLPGSEATRRAAEDASTSSSKAANEEKK